MTISLSQTIDIDADAATVWAIIADYSKDQLWRRGIVSMTSTPSGLVQDGMTTREVIRVAGKTWTNLGLVTSVDPARKFHWCTTEGASASGSRQVSSIVDGGCRVTLELQVTPTGLDRLIAPIAGPMLRRNLRRDSAALLALATTAKPQTSRAESGSPASPA